MAQLKTFCIGRHLVDLPSTFELVPGSSGIFKTTAFSDEDSGIDIAINAGAMTVLQFAAAIETRRNELKKTGSATVDKLEFEKVLDERGVLFRVRRVKDAYVSEINLLRGTTFVTATLNSYHAKYREAEDALLGFAQQITERQTVESAAEGFCLGPITISGDYKQESANVLFRDSADKGTAFDILLDTYTPDPESSLLERVATPVSLLTKFNAQHKVLRKREFRVAGMRAQEWLGSIELNDKKQFGFAMETLREKPNRQLPRIRISFDTGQPGEDGSVSDKVMADQAALRLWDTVVASVRPNPKVWIAAQ